LKNNQRCDLKCKIKLVLVLLLSSLINFKKLLLLSNKNHVRTRGAWSHPLCTRGAWAMPMGEQSQRTHDAWAMPVGWALLSAHVELGRRWVGDRWRLGHS